MEDLMDQPEPGIAVPSLPAAPDVVPVRLDAHAREQRTRPTVAVLECAVAVLECARSDVQARFAAADAALVAGATPDFTAIAVALLRLADCERRALAATPCGPAQARFERLHAAQPVLAGAVADLAHASREDDLQRALLRRRLWLYRDGFAEALAARRREFAGAAAAAN